MAVCADLQANWLPARLEQIYQRDRHTLSLCLRTLSQRGWLTLSWHPLAARVCLDEPPPRTPDTFTFSQQLRHQIQGLALIQMEAIAPWERVLDLQFGRRPGEPAQWHLYLEIMGKYSNVILTTPERQIVTVARQVSSEQSSVRPLLTGQPYEFPPALTDAAPSLTESQAHWRDRLTLIPGPLRKTLQKNYRGLSSALLLSMLHTAGIEPDRATSDLRDEEWDRLYACWQTWLRSLDQRTFQPGWMANGGYTVMGWNLVKPEPSVQTLIRCYYANQLNRQEFGQLHHHLSQRVATLLAKLYVKAQDFRDRLQQSDHADLYKHQADLLMAYLHEWQPGMQSITLPDFISEMPLTIRLDPEKNAVQNAQALYKRHQKLKRSRLALEPLLAEVQAEIDYLEQVQVAIAQTSDYSTVEDLRSLEEIRDELIQQKYLDDPDQRFRDRPSESTHFRRYQTPSGQEVWIGRNNHQNDQLTFRIANEYDLWFHSQEIPGSHVLLRMQPGHTPDQADLQYAADLAALYSRAHQSEQVPVIYTEPKNVYKPKGAKPGTVIYKQERVIWAQPQRGKTYLPLATE